MIQFCFEYFQDDAVFEKWRWCSWEAQMGCCKYRLARIENVPSESVLRALGPD